MPEQNFPGVMVVPGAHLRSSLAGSSGVSVTVDAHRRGLQWRNIFLHLLLGLTGFGIVFAIVGRPLTLAGAAVAIVAFFLVSRQLFCVMAVVFTAPIEGYISDYIHPLAIKACGVLLIVSWLANMVRSKRMVIARHRLTLLLLVFSALVLGSFAVHPNLPNGFTFVIRYVPFIALALIVATFVAEKMSIVPIIGAYVAGATIAACGALYSFIINGDGRAAGPMDDPNDLAYTLVAGIPLAAALAIASRRRIMWLIVAILGASVAMTLSRGGGVALAVIIIWLIWRGWVSSRAIINVFALILAAGFVILLVVPSARIQDSLAQKTYIGGQNIENRALRWEAAGKMLLAAPLLGTGPGGFAINYVQYSNYAEPAEPRPFSHNMYIDIGAELGFPAMVIFVAFLGVAWRSLSRITVPVSDRNHALLAKGIQASLLGIATASVFLTEQYFVPLWLCVGLAAGLHSRYQLSISSPRSEASSLSLEGSGHV